MPCAEDAPDNYAVYVSVRNMNNVLTVVFPNDFASPTKHTIQGLPSGTRGRVIAQVMQGDQLIGWPEEKEFETEEGNKC